MIIGTANGLEKFDKCPVSTLYLISSGLDCHIRCVRCVKYLGIIVDDTLTWEEHIEYISVKIKRGIGILKVAGKFLKRESLILIYRTLIEPYVRYCSIVWGRCNETQKDKLQALQNKADRTIAKVKFNDADHTRLLQDLDWLNIRNLFELNMGILCTSAKINLCQTLLQIFSGQLIVCTLIKHELQNQEIYIFQNQRC